MECYSCSELGAIPTGCCNLYAHPQCIENFNNFSNRIMEKRYECVQCKRSYGNQMKNEIRRLRVTAQVSEISEVEIKTKKPIIKILIIISIWVISLIVYFWVGYLFINKGYLIPKEIKKNQKIQLCEAVKITYVESYYNNTHIFYNVEKAYTKEGHDISNLFSDYTCSICPYKLETYCWAYKKYFYYGINKTDVNKQFLSGYYTLWFIGVGFIFMICILAVFCL